MLKTAREPPRQPNKVLIAGTGIESASRNSAADRICGGLGYDVAMVRTPHFYKRQMQPANMLAFYRTVADRSPLPVMIYNFPQATGYDMPAELVIELADHPNIIGIKESSGDVEKARKIVDGTRHVKRSATVTETFDAVTPRMLKAATEGQGRAGNWCRWLDLADCQAVVGRRSALWAGSKRVKRKSDSRFWSGGP